MKLSIQSAYRKYASCLARKALNLSILATLLVYTLPAQATFQFLPKPPDQGAPTGRQRGGANRGDCLAYQGLTAIVPEVEGIVWSQTASDSPTFFFNIPAALTESVPLEFVIQDSNDDYVFRKQFAVDAEAGTLAIFTNGLTANQSYSWTFAVYCDANRPSASVSVSGTVQRVEAIALSLEQTAIEQLSDSEKLELIRRYAADGIWHEAIALAISLRESDPSNVEHAEPLENLLTQAGLTNVSLLPLFIEHYEKARDLSSTRTISP